jgi:hypothetical protein
MYIKEAEYKRLQGYGEAAKQLSQINQKINDKLIALEEENAQLKAELKKAHEEWDVLAVENIELS